MEMLFGTPNTNGYSGKGFKGAINSVTFIMAELD